MRLWLAEVVELGVNLLCALTGHARGCAVMRLLDRTHWWAVDTRERALDYPGRHDCPICAKPRSVPESVEWELTTEPTTYTASSGQSIVWYARPKGSA